MVKSSSVCLPTSGGYLIAVENKHVRLSNKPIPMIILCYTPSVKADPEVSTKLEYVIHVY